MSLLTVLSNMSLWEKHRSAIEDSSAIRKLLWIEDMLIMEHIVFRRMVDSELLCAKRNSTDNKRAALQALKRKKRYEKEIGQIDETLTTIGDQCEALRNVNTNAEVSEIVKFVSEFLNNAPRMGIGELKALSQEFANEKSDAISNPAGFDRELDEVELAELEKLEKGDLDEQLLAVGQSVAERSSKFQQLEQFVLDKTNLGEVERLKCERIGSMGFI